MIVYADYIFPQLFGDYDKVKDINKDINGKGTLERFNEIVGEDLDSNVTPLVENLLANIYVTESMQEKFLGHMEQMKGVTIFLYNTTVARRAILKVIFDLYNLKGLMITYNRLFAMGGYPNAFAQALNARYGFDSPTTFDDEDRTFDSGCPSCSKFNVIVPKATAFTEEERTMFSNIINFNTPVNLQLRGFYRLPTVGDLIPHQIEPPTKANRYKYKILNEI